MECFTISLFVLLKHSANIKNNNLNNFILNIGTNPQNMFNIHVINMFMKTTHFIYNSQNL
jgi:hypothetical protein